MARGYPGAFGRMINAPYIWLPLCAIFVLGPARLAPAVPVRRTWTCWSLPGSGSPTTSSTGGTSASPFPLAYPPLLYLPAGSGSGSAARRRWPAPVGADHWLLARRVLLIGGRIGLNVADSNVIDVGYSGVIGADRIADGTALRQLPRDDGSGDTYGPLAYYAYVPFEQVFPLERPMGRPPGGPRGLDLLRPGNVAGLFLLGRQLRPGRGGPSSASARFRLGRLPLLRLRARVQHQRRARLAALVAPCWFLRRLPPGARACPVDLTKFAPARCRAPFATYGEGWRADVTATGGARGEASKGRLSPG